MLFILILFIVPAFVMSAVVLGSGLAVGAISLWQYVGKPAIARKA